MKYSKEINLIINVVVALAWLYNFYTGGPIVLLWYLLCGLICAVFGFFQGVINYKQYKFAWKVIIFWMPGLFFPQHGKFYNWILDIKNVTK